LLAAANPQIEFYATDFNPAHAVGAAALAAEARTPNVRFLDKSFAEFLNEPSLPMFDIISLHGIYAWVVPEHRRSIVEFARQKLKPGGLVYVSYNALPGWAVAAPLRQLIYLYGKARSGPTMSRLASALDAVSRIVEVNAGFFRANPSSKDFFEKLGRHNRAYLAHEYLNEAWTPFYHSQVAAELEAAKLSFLGSAALLEHVDSINLTADQQSILADLDDPTIRETIRDYMVNQQFRRDVFVKGGVALNPLEADNLWLNRRFVLSTTRADVPLTFATPQGEATVKQDIYGPVLDVLANGPRTVRELTGDRRVRELVPALLREALVVLTGAGHLQPALDQKGDKGRSVRTNAFNAAVIKRSNYDAELQFLASPVTGGGVAVDRFSQLFLSAEQQKNADPPQTVWDVLNGQNQRIIKEGKTLDSPDENLAELRMSYDAFLSKKLPVLRQMGIA
jgi:hypothetical protein